MMMPNLWIMTNILKNIQILKNYFQEKIIIMSQLGIYAKL